MARKTLAELQAAFASKNSTANANSNQDWKKFYQFWKMKTDEMAIVRFLPDLDEDNNLGFLVENHVHELNINGKRETVPCLAMFGEACPICEASRLFYAEEGDSSARGKKYYRKKSHIGQVLVVESPFEHDKTQTVMLMEFGPKIFKLIQAAFKDSEMDNAPYELKGGYNFRIKKTKNGEYADYGTSSFSAKSTNVEDDVIADLNLYNLSDFRAKRMDVDTLRAMLEADMHGGSVAIRAPAATPDVPASNVPKQEAPQNQAAASPPPAQDASAEGSNQDYLATIRARAAAKKAAAADA